LYTRQSAAKSLVVFSDGLDIQGDSGNYIIGFQYRFYLGDDGELVCAITAGFKRASSS
jgi:hypothetical protein